MRVIAPHHAKGSNSPQSLLPPLAAGFEAVFFFVGCNTPEEDQPGGPLLAVDEVGDNVDEDGGSGLVAPPSGLSCPNELVCGSNGGNPLEPPRVIVVVEEEIGKVAE